MPNAIFDESQPVQDQAPVMPQASAATQSQQPPTTQQALHIDLDNEELFARERLSSTQKTIIVLVVIGVFTALLIAGYFLYARFYAEGGTAALAEEVLEVPAAVKDTDGDGLPDDREKAIGTNVNDPDTDGDGYSDGEEVQNGYSPLAR